MREHAWIWLFEYVIPIIITLYAVYRRDEVFRDWWAEQQHRQKRNQGRTYRSLLKSIGWICIGLCAIIFFLHNLHRD